MRKNDKRGGRPRKEDGDRKTMVTSFRTDGITRRHIDRMVNLAMVSDWQQVLQRLGYDNTQYMLVRHSEKSNPHSHCILNMVDNDGKRLKDHGEIRRGVKICREITIERGYGWGEHKSVSQSRSERPYEKERQSTTYFRRSRPWAGR